MKTERTESIKKKRRVAFYMHLKRMDAKSLIKKLFNYFDQNPKTQMNLFKKVKVNIREIRINQEEIKYKRFQG